MLRWRIGAAWPARYDIDKGLFRAFGAVQIVTMDEHDGERYARTAANMREAAQMLVSQLPTGSVARFCAISPHKTSARMHPFPFTHRMHVDEQDWTGPRDWFVALVENSERR